MELCISVKDNKLRKKIDRDNNLNALKLICALFVILHHSYSISLGPDYIDPFRRLTNDQFTLGNFSVTVFLFLAGFLITKSALESNSVKEFMLKRIKRIFPSLILVILFTVFIIGPIFTQLSIVEYFTNFSTWKYLVCNCLLITNHQLPVFLNNIYHLSPNGSLWTLPVEFICYIGICLCSTLKILKKEIIKFIPLFIAIIYLMQSKIINLVPTLWPAIQLFLFFGLGVFLYFFKDKLKLHIIGLISCIAIFILSIILNIYSYLNILIVPYLVCFFAFGIKKKIPILNRLGNYSYEIYLLGFLVQQVVFSVFSKPTMNPYMNFMISLPIVLILSIPLNKISHFIVRVKK